MKTAMALTVADLMCRQEVTENLMVYLTQGVLGTFWTSSPNNSVDKAWAWNFHYGGPPSSNKQNLKKAFRFDAGVSNGLSVRLVRD